MTNSSVDSRTYMEIRVIRVHIFIPAHVKRNS